MFYCQVEEIKNNHALTQLDVKTMTYYIRQTFERYSLMVAKGYLVAEEAFQDPNGDTTFVKPFDPDCAESLLFANCALGRNLELMRWFCWEAQDPRAFLEDSGVTDGFTSGGLNDFLFETVPPSMAFQSLADSGVMETLYGPEKVHWLLIHFFAKLKLVYGCLEDPNTPDMDMIHLHLDALGVHSEHFSFRELTVLSGYKTERAIRNLASPSTPKHRRLSVIKEGRHTFVEAGEARRWLKTIKGDI